MLINACVHACPDPDAIVADEHPARACGEGRQYVGDRAPLHWKRAVMPAAPHPIQGAIDADASALGEPVARAVMNK